MEEAASENDVSDATPKGNNPHLFSYPKTDKLVENAQNSQGQSSGYQKPYQGRTYVLNQAQHNQFLNQKQQTSQQTASSPTTASQDEMKGLATMMQQMLQASHMRQMDVQIAQTAESVKRQQGTLPGKTDKNPKECSAVALRSGRTLPDAVPKKLSAAEKGKQKEAKTSRKDQEETKCKKMLEDLTIKLPRMDAVQMIPSMRSLIKVLISGKITGDSELLLVSKECTAIIPYEMHCGGNTRHRTRDRKGSLRSDRTRVLLGRYVATKSKPKLGRYVATERPFRPIAMQRPSSS
ncbi:hypothetical protein F2Q70_00036218 [Brassica cretica]|uniref:Uncharacterized protein n=1 Tax=Brassica cretica TaxID=69181 RepID=A0A8S9JRA1_BRACR|nr:hypothetical protein F2Q70_00036218 [Brassica cretica]